MLATSGATPLLAILEGVCDRDGDSGLGKAKEPPKRKHCKEASIVHEKMGVRLSQLFLANHT